VAIRVLTRIATHDHLDRRLTAALTHLKYMKAPFLAPGARKGAFMYFAKGGFAKR